jgi:hypothetical protein
VPTSLFVVVVAAGGFAIDVFHHFGGAGGLQIGGHAAQGDTENIAVVQFLLGVLILAHRPTRQAHGRSHAGVGRRKRLPHL